MIKYESPYKELRFHVDGELHKFSNGEYSTEDKKVQAVIGKLQYVRKVEEDVVVEEEKPKRKPKAKNDEDAAE